MENEIFDLLIEDINSKGQGVAHLDGLAIFVEDALVGERVRARILAKKKSYAVAQVVELVKTSNQRVVPKCPYFKSCGGCQLQHMSVDGQLEYKKGRINNAFKRIGGIKDHLLKLVEPSKNSFYYRNKIQLPVKMGKDGPFLGFYKRASHEIVKIQECHLHLRHIKPLFDAINYVLGLSKISVYSETSHKGILRHVFIRSSEFSKESVICLVVSSFNKQVKLLAEHIVNKYPEVKGVCYQVHKKPTNAVVFSDVKVVYGRHFIRETILGLDIKISVGAFFQVNTQQAQNVYETILEFGNFSSDETVLDAYCGIATLTLLIAKKVKRVIGVECVSSAIFDAKHNMQLNHIKNAEFKVAKVESIIESLHGIDCVFLNPPRKGCDANFLRVIAKNGVKRLIYMSCDPASLARDVKLLLTLGYEITRSQAFDMFCQTTHVETLLFLTKKLDVI